MASVICRVLLVITYRPEFIPPWGTRAHLTQLAMNRLSARACTGLVGDLARGKELPEEVLRQIIAKADGVPLFVEELTKAVLESGLLTEETDAWRLDGPLPPLAIPSSLHDFVHGPSRPHGTGERSRAGRRRNRP